MHCPNCPDRGLVKNGTNDGTGTQRYRCTACGYSMTDSDNIQGGALYGAVKRTNAEHQAAHRMRKRLRDAIAKAENQQNKETQ